jgi:hypothetical protein
MVRKLFLASVTKLLLSMHVFTQFLLLQLLDSAKKMKFLDVTVKEAVANALVAVEIGCWFYLGEMIGRRHIIGYSIPNTHH